MTTAKSIGARFLANAVLERAAHGAALGLDHQRVFTPDAARLVDVVTGAWTRLASGGRPGGVGLRWPRLGRSGRYLVLDPTPSIARDVKADVCAFWKQLGWTLGAQ